MRGLSVLSAGAAKQAAIKPAQLVRCATESLNHILHGKPLHRTWVGSAWLIGSTWVGNAWAASACLARTDTGKVRGRRRAFVDRFIHQSGKHTPTRYQNSKSRTGRMDACLATSGKHRAVATWGARSPANALTHKPPPAGAYDGRATATFACGLHRSVHWAPFMAASHATSHGHARAAPARMNYAARVMCPEPRALSQMQPYRRNKALVRLGDG